MPASEWVPAIGLGVAFMPYFLVRGWLTAAVVLIFLFCVLQLALGRVAFSRELFTHPVLWLLAALVAPLLAVFAVQLLRQELVPRYFDAPARLAMSGVILLYLIDRRVNFVRIAEIVLPLATLLCAALIFLYPGASDHFWEGRFATYFMDPLMLSQHITIVGFLCLFSVDADGRDGWLLRLLKYAGFAAAMAVSMGTQSRTGWLMVPILGAVWLIGFKRQNSTARILLVLAAIVAGCAAIYFVSDIIRHRADSAVADVLSYFNGGSKDTSLGIRLSLFRANWILFLQSPIYGWGFHGVPAVTSIPEIAAFATPLMQYYFVETGGHNELMQSMMRMGLLGLVSRLLMFLAPLVVFARAARTEHPRRRAAGYMGLAVVIGYMTASLSSEVINLIYAGSFYALLVAALGASALYEERK